jgi:hypothetical protein
MSLTPQEIVGSDSFSNLKKELIMNKNLNIQSITIVYKSDKNGCMWAWEESAKRNVWGFCQSAKQMKEKAKRMFKGKKLRYILL